MILQLDVFYLVFSHHEKMIADDYIYIAFKQYTFSKSNLQCILLNDVSVNIVSI